MTPLITDTDVDGLPGITCNVLVLGHYLPGVRDFSTYTVSADLA